MQTMNTRSRPGSIFTIKVKWLHSNCTRLRIIMMRTNDHNAWFEEMRTWPDGWNGYDALAPKAEAIDQAKAWLEKLQFVIATEEWIEPTFITGTGDGDVTIEWREGKQGVSFFFDGKPAIDYLKVWGS